MKFNVRVTIFGKDFNVKNIEADNEFQAELKVRKLIADTMRVKNVQPAWESHEDQLKKSISGDPILQQLKDILGMK